MPTNEAVKQPQMSDMDQAMADIIKAKKDSFGKNRSGFILEVKCNIAYLCGHQNIHIMGERIDRLPKRFSTEVVANRILPAVTNDIAIASKNNPVYDIVPTSTDEDDKATAEAAQKLIPYIQRINGSDLGRKGTVMWYDLSGVGWRKVRWEHQHKVSGWNPIDEEDPSFNPQMAPGAPLFEGELIVEVVPPTELIYDTRCKDLKKLKWIIHTKMISVAEARARFGEEFVQTINPSEVYVKPSNHGNFELQIMDDFGIITNYLAGTTHSEKSSLLPDDRMVPYDEFWHVPCAEMPLGSYAVKVGDRMAVNEPYPVETYPHREIPFIACAPMAIEGILGTAPSRVSQARPLQREYNQLRSIILDNIDAMGNSVFMASRESNISYKKLDNCAANIVEYDGIYKPSREQGVQVPGTFFAYMEEVKQSIDEVFTFYASGRGQVAPGGPDSGHGIQLLQEAAMTQFGPIITELDQSDERVVYQALVVGMANYGDRLLPVVGSDKSWTVERINFAELNGKISVMVRSGSSLPLSKALEAEKAFAVWQSGLLGDPMSPMIRNFTLRQMDVGNIENVLRANDKHVNFARKEFSAAERMALEIPPMDPETLLANAEELLYMPPVNEFDDHSVHIQEHTNDYLDKHWKYVQSGNPALEVLDQAMRMHIQMHKQTIADEQNASMSSQMNAEAFTKGNTENQILLKQAAQMQRNKIDASRPEPKPAPKSSK